MSDSEDTWYDGPCTVCGSSVHKTSYVALALFAFVTEQQDGMWFTPDQSPASYAAWEDVAMKRTVHATCLPLYLEGLALEAANKRRMM